ncbi:glucosamine-6-phosphate isomerase [Pochonia chlamydosporia 170]|uniref:Glucosamine-6-phosphate isomerase n=1 Tax=Pochonia chlamydosporia 170 TaxID=1380566 RepID=A0A179F0F0_METCM|nr:glucosamine-6-phosphate isomerase [Pochonia chlamydosporia 170]OAQ58935.1 glucosamine-6-phosphate isomerase [Pochonia chlamydosporia 170]
MRLIVRQTAEVASRYVVQYITTRINEFGPTQEKPFVLGLPTGSSPLNIYRSLIEAFRDGKVTFRHVVTFNMDEYVGLPPEHPESYHSFMHKNFFDHVDLQPENINILDGNAPDLAAECLAYEEKIIASGGIELFLGGVGVDGHIAFNEPGSSLASRTRIKSLAYEMRLANSRFFGGEIDAVPRMALTVGVQTIMDAREVVIIATGPAKASAVHQAVESGISHWCTLSCLQLHPRSMVVVDEDATLEMRVKTIKYYKEVEQIAEQGNEAEQKASGSIGPVTPRTTARDCEDGDLTPDSMASRNDSLTELRH